MSFFDTLRNLVFSERVDVLSETEKEQQMKNFVQAEFTREDVNQLKEIASQMSAFDYQVGILRNTREDEHLLRTKMNTRYGAK